MTTTRLCNSAESDRTKGSATGTNEIEFQVVGNVAKRRRFAAAETPYIDDL